MVRHEAIAVEHDNSIESVPTTFREDDLEEPADALPDVWDVDRIFTHHGTLYAEGQLGDRTWAEAAYLSEKEGWVAREIALDDDDEHLEFGETVWTRGEGEN